MNIQKDTILSFFKETISPFNERLDKVLTDVQDLKKFGPKQSDRQRIIVCKLLNFNDNELIQDNVRSLRGTAIYINEDFSEETAKLCKELFQQQNNHLQNGKYARVIYNQLVVCEFHETTTTKIKVFLYIISLFCYFQRRNGYKKRTNKRKLGKSKI